MASFKTLWSTWPNSSNIYGKILQILESLIKLKKGNALTTEVIAFNRTY